MPAQFMKYVISISLSLICIVANASELSESQKAKWEKTKIEVASIMGIGGQFHRSLRNFKYNSATYDEEYVLVKGDLNHDISDMLLIHIIGDLNATVTLQDHSELIVMGDVSKDSIIHVNGFAKIFIAGSLYGSILSIESSDIYIKEHMRGLITTGSPATKIEIDGDYLGEIRPNGEKEHLATITVRGFTDIKSINDIFSYKYTDLKAAFHYSNKEPGIYEYLIPSNKFYTIINQSK